MDRATRDVLHLSVCPICFDAAGALADAARTGAGVLAVVLAGVLAVMVRFAWRLWRAEAE